MPDKKKIDILNGKNLADSAILLAVVSAFNIYAGLALAGIAAAYFIYLLFGEEALVAFTIITFLTVTEKLGESIRLVVQVVNFLLLIFLFVKRYGAEFEKYPGIPKSVKIFLALLYSAFLLSFVFTSYKELAFQQILRTTIFLALIYLYYSLINSEKGVKIVVTTLLVITFAFGVYLFYEFYLSNFDLLHLNAKLFSYESNSYLHKNTYAIYFAIAIPILSVKFLTAEKREIKLSLLISILFFLTGLIITNSRSVLLALFISATYLIYKINKKYLLYPLIVVVLLLPLIFIEPFSSWLDLYFRVERISTGRDWILQTLFNIPWKYFIFGTGPAATQFFMWEYLPFQIGSPEQMWMEHHFKMLTYGHAHNFYLFYFSDLGILGLLSSLYLVYSFFHESGKDTILHEKERRLLSYGLTAAGISIFARGIFEWSGILSYGEINKDLPFWLIFISLIIFVRRKEDEKKIS